MSLNNLEFQSFLIALPISSPGMVISLPFLKPEYVMIVCSLNEVLPATVISANVYFLPLLKFEF